MKFFNRVRQLTSTEGAGDTIALGAAFNDAFLTLAEAGGAISDETVIVVEQGADFGLYRVIVGSAAASVTIDQVLVSKIGGTAGTTRLDLNGSAQVRVAESAEDLNAILQAISDLADILDTLGDAAFKNTGTDAGSVAAGDDSRFNIAGQINAASAKSTPHDNDLLGLVDSQASNVLKKLSWTNVKATLKTYFDTLYQPVASALTSWAGVTRATGFDTFVATPSSANLRALLTDESGSGVAYFQGGALGTPASGNLSNCSNYPASSLTVPGVNEFATAAEYRTGTDPDRGLNVAQVWAAALNATLTDGATIAVDLAAGFNFGGGTGAKLNLGGSRTLGAPTNVKGGQSGILWFGATGSTRTLTLNAAWTLMTGVEVGPYSITTSQTLGVAYCTLGTTVYVTAILRHG